MAHIKIKSSQQTIPEEAQTRNLLEKDLSYYKLVQNSKRHYIQKIKDTIFKDTIFEKNDVSPNTEYP